MKWSWEDIVESWALAIAFTILAGLVLFGVAAILFVLFGTALIKIVLFLLACWAIGKGIGWWQRKQKGR